MAFGKIARSLLATAVAVPLALFVGAHALSSVLTKANPAFAVQVFPWNGQALAELAFADYISSITDPAAPPAPSAEAVALAREAVRREPLSARAYVVLAQAEPDPERRRAIIDAASSINRRDSALQGLVLQEHLADEDYQGAIATLDQILRVHPDLSQQFFPLLVSALAEEATIPAFANILDGSSPWHERFLAYAVGSAEVAPNLARLRPELSIGTEDFDKRLIAALVSSGDIDGARRIYIEATRGGNARSTSGILDWQATYPPFDWAFSDKGDFRAQPSRDGRELEIYVKPGQGGVIASRVLPAPPGPFVVELKHTIAPLAQIEDVQIQLGCEKREGLFLEQRLKPGLNRIRFEVPPGCRYLIVNIEARAWTGKAALSGAITGLAIRPVSE